jgi:hypothetical protein
MSTAAETTFSPLVKGATTSQSPNVRSVMDCLDDETYYVPEYQRDSSQWDTAKKSLFIESLINNLTIPPLIAYPEDDPNTGKERWQIVDGQQRITTVKEFLRDGFPLSNEADVEYAENVGPLIQGRKFSQLLPSIRKQIERYTLNFILLPKNLLLPMRLEIFRRINEGGVPLSAQDLRLAIFGESPRVTLIRLAGIFDLTREGPRRMIDAAKRKYGIDYPWKNHAGWKGWWSDKAQSVGQEASQMFLYYVLARDLPQVETLIKSGAIQTAVKLKYDKSTVSVLDLYCAQLEYEEQPTAPKVVADFATLNRWFGDFELWFNTIKTEKVARIPVNSSTKIAFFIAAASGLWKDPSTIKERQWEKIQTFLTQGPGKIAEVLGMEYPSTRGKWPGQKTQIERTFEICQMIAKT